MSLVSRVALRVRTQPRLSRLVLKLVPDLPLRVSVEGLGRFRVHLRRNRWLFLRDPWEVERTPFAMLQHMVAPGDVVFDVGANLGLYCRFLVQRLGAGAVVAFEPIDENLRSLRINLKLGGIESRVTVVPLAVADSDGMSTFQLDDVQSASGTLDEVTEGAPSVGRQNLGLGPRTRTVPCRRLPTAIAEFGLPTPRVIKLDVEGAEAMLLRGAASWLAEEQPDLVIELHGAQVAREVLSLLDDLGYSSVAAVDRRIDPSGFMAVDSSLNPQIVGLYDVHFVAASCDPARLPRSLRLDAEGPQQQR